MAKTKKHKQEIINEYKAKLEKSKTLYVITPKGLTPNDATMLKKELTSVDATYNVVKNTLFKIALNEQKLPELEYFEGGEHAVLFAGENMSEAAKILKKFGTKTEKIEILGGLLNGEKIAGTEVEALAELPSKEQLLAQLLSVINGPIRGFVTVINGPIRNMAYVLRALEEKKAVA